MNHYFKAYLKNAAAGGLIGATFGSACGSVAGNSGLKQMCSGQMDTPSCNYLVDHSTNGSYSAGAETGAAVGFLLGITLYPAYRALVSCKKNLVDDRQDQAQENRAMLSTGETRQALSV